MNSAQRLFPLALLAACGPTISPTPDDAIVQSRVVQSTLAATFHQDGDYWVSPVLEVPEAATRVGAMLEVEVDRAIAIEVRAVDPWQGAGPWLPLQETWREGRLRVARADLNTVAWSAQLRLPLDDAGHLVELIWSPVVPREPVDEQRPYVVEPSTHALLPNLEAWSVRPRSAWQARAPTCRRADEKKTRMAVHHTAGSPGDPGMYDAKLRQIQAFHMDTNEWCDIGYHFLVSLDGTAWEGRELFDQGAHVLDHNTANIGLSFVGCFHPSSDCASIAPQTPPDVMLTAGGEIIGVLAHMYQLNVDAATIKGHREFSGTATACPGDNLASRLGDLRATATATLGQFEDQCGCDFTNECDAECACDPQCKSDDDGGCAAVPTSPIAALALALVVRRRRRG